MSGALPSAQPRNEGYPVSFAGMTPEERAKLLAETNLFAAAHETAAAGGQSNMPEGLKTDSHFVAFIQAPDVQDITKRRIVELDGRRSGPVDLGESKELLAVSPSTAFTSSNFVRRMPLASLRKSTWMHSIQFPSP